MVALYQWAKLRQYGSHFSSFFVMLLWNWWSKSLNILKFDTRKNIRDFDLIFQLLDFWFLNWKWQCHVPSKWALSRFWVSLYYLVICRHFTVNVTSESHIINVRESSHCRLVNLGGLGWNDCFKWKSRQKVLRASQCKSMKVIK